MITDSSTPLTDALVHPNGCIAPNLLEHARKMESDANLYRQVSDQLKARGYRKEEIIENLTKENEALKIVLSLLQNDLAMADDQRDNIQQQLITVNAELLQYKTMSKGSVWTPRRGI